MEISEDTLNPIVTFLHKLLGNNLWILPTALAVTSWIMWFIEGSNWFLAIAILSSTISILYICTVIYTSIKSKIISRKEAKAATKHRQREEAEKVLEEENRERKHASKVWKLVAHTKMEAIDLAAFLLSLEIHDGQECLRFCPIRTTDNYEKQRLQWQLTNLHLHFEYNSPNYAHIKLIQVEQFPDVIYFNIEPYFYKLLKHYVDTKKWEKI